VTLRTLLPLPRVMTATEARRGLILLPITSKCLPIAKVGFGRKPALYPARAEGRLFDMALKLSKMV
jgi:hypothetical protein